MVGKANLEETEKEKETETELEADSGKYANSIDVIKMLHRYLLS